MYVGAGTGVDRLLGEKEVLKSVENVSRRGTERSTPIALGGSGGPKLTRSEDAMKRATAYFQFVNPRGDERSAKDECARSYRGTLDRCSGRQG